MQGGKSEKLLIFPHFSTRASRSMSLKVVVVVVLVVVIYSKYVLNRT